MSPYCDLREKVIDNRFLALIHRLLKAGVNIDGIVHPTEKGVPQGGVVSPLLSNMVLNKLHWFLHAQGRHGNEQGYAWKAGRPNVRFVRYADDWCVFITRSSQQHAERLRDRIRVLLTQQCGVELSMEKTRITHVRDGFDFLGFHLELGVGRNGTYVPKVRVSRKAVTNIVHRLNEVMRRLHAQRQVYDSPRQGRSIAERRIHMDRHELDPIYGPRIPMNRHFVAQANTAQRKLDSHSNPKT